MPIPLPEDPFYYYPPVYAWVSQVIFRQVSLPKPCMHLSFLPYVLVCLGVDNRMLLTWAWNELWR
jgi:hypothetical protein